MIVAVVGAGGDVDATTLVDARDAGRLVVEARHTLLTGGLGGVMEAASEGAASAEGEVLGLLPSLEGRTWPEPNPYVTLPLYTGVPPAVRNYLLTNVADALVACFGRMGTTQEVTMALEAETPVVAWRTSVWEHLDVPPLATEDALAGWLAALGPRPGRVLGDW